MLKYSLRHWKILFPTERIVGPVGDPMRSTAKEAMLQQNGLSDCFVGEVIEVADAKDLQDEAIHGGHA